MQLVRRANDAEGFAIASAIAEELAQIGNQRRDVIG